MRSGVLVVGNGAWKISMGPMFERLRHEINGVRNVHMCCVALSFFLSECTIIIIHCHNYKK